MVGGPTENEPVSLKLIGCLVRVSWRGSGYRRAVAFSLPVASITQQACLL